MTETQIAILVNVVFGSGLLIAIVRGSYMLGRYSQRVENLDTSVAALTESIRELRTEMNSFRERRLTGISDRRSSSG